MTGIEKDFIVSDDFIVREPLLPLSVFGSLAEGNVQESIERLMKKKRIQEALYIASPGLYKEWGKAKIKGGSDKLYWSLLKYLTRMSTRPTPFGLSAGVTVKRFGEPAEIEKSRRRRTRLDSRVEHRLYEVVMQVPEVKDKMNYFLNGSVFHANGHYVYMRKKGPKKNKTWTTIKVKGTENLQICIDHLKSGSTIEEMVSALEDEGYDQDESRQFIYNLVEADLAVPQILPHLIGPSYLETLTDYLKDSFPDLKFAKDIMVIRNLLKEIDSNEFNDISAYEKILEVLGEHIDVSEFRNPFHVELFNNSKIETLDVGEKAALKRGVSLLGKTHKYQKVQVMEEFKSSYSEKYVAGPVRLVEVLDSELGIGYPSNQISRKYWYLEGIDFEFETKRKEVAEESSLEKYLNNELKRGNREKEILLNEKILEGNTSGYSELTPSFYSLVERVEINGKRFFYMPFISGMTASALLGRFTGCERKLDVVIEKIFNHEREFLSDEYIPMEIEHFSDEKLGNITSRKSFRGHKLSYLSGSAKNTGEIIRADDIYIENKDGVLTLTIGKNGKSIMPFLSNAHNYSRTKVPLYRFLADFPSFKFNASLKFEWGEMLNYSSYMPRIRQGNIILSKARWSFSKDVLNRCFASKDAKEKEELIDEFISLWKLPRYVSLIDSDRYLVLDLESEAYRQLFIYEVEKLDSFELEEYLHTDFSNNKSSNELLVVFKRNVRNFEN